MLFLVVHTHIPESCPVENPIAVEKLIDKDHIQKSGLKVLGNYISAPEHTLFFVLEADDYSQVVRYLRPMMTIGTPRIYPVETLEKSLGVVKEG